MTKKYSDIKRKKIRNEKVEKGRKFKTEDENRDQGQKVWEGLQMQPIQKQKIYIIQVKLPVFRFLTAKIIFKCHVKSAIVKLACLTLTNWFISST